MLSIIIIWLIIFILVIVSISTNKNFFWIPVILYIISVLVRAKEIIENYNDMEKKSIRDEKSQLEQKAEEMAQRGLTFSSKRTQEEEKIKENFKFEKKKRKRKMWVNLINTLFLK